MYVCPPALLSLVLTASLARNGQAPAPIASGATPEARRDREAPREQPPDTAGGEPPTRERTDLGALFTGLKVDIRRLPSVSNVEIAAVGGGLALGAHAFDKTLNTRLLNPSGLATAIFAPGTYLGDTPEQLAFSIGTWLLGRATHKPRMAHLGMDLLRAQALTVIMVEPLKLATHRERPDGSNYQSFPSGHAAITFAAATVIERHLGWKHSVAAYAIASYVAASRLFDNKHYLSDVVFGAAVGTIAGRTVTMHGRDAWTLVPAHVPGGVAIVATRTAF
jgi:membrane-associated phospholipid phosphatase